ncbi:MAG TPA: hypothetical protein VEH27_09360 [Methylomirabilota bacterium]|nr:hypothetical protein [Methylomirabilota bacterium]
MGGASSDVLVRVDAVTAEHTVLVERRLESASWSDSTLQPLANGSAREVNVEAVGEKQFFRLHQR